LISLKIVKEIKKYKSYNIRFFLPHISAEGISFEDLKYQVSSDLGVLLG
jgi:hypothetical protein